MAAVLNAGNNALNQIYDLEIDRVNKPKRPLPSGRLSMTPPGGSPSSRTRLRSCSPGWSRPAAGTNASGSSSSPCLHLCLFGAAVEDEAGRHLGKRHHRHPSRCPPQGRRLVLCQDDRRPGALVHRRDLRLVPARRVDDEGFRRHGGRSRAAAVGRCRSLTA